MRFLWLGVSHRLWSRDWSELQTFQGWTVRRLEDSLPGSLRCLLDVDSSSVSHGSIYRASHSMAAYIPQSKGPRQERDRERESQERGASYSLFVFSYGK